MKNPSHLKDVFIVVKVHSGLPTIAEAFLKESDAYNRARTLKRGTNPAYDEVDVFHSPIKGRF